jgi:hypothetical protein
MDTGEFRDVGHRLVDLLSEYLERIEERPLFPTVEPAALNALFAEPLPDDPSSSSDVLDRSSLRIRAVFSNKSLLVRGLGESSLCTMFPCNS